ncbi:Barrierpepsin [Arthrobotrys entomopaga]|nr:Barrierpepsin [Arthrobotrys entomopaga]
MGWLLCFQLAILLVIFPFSLPVSALIIPREVDQSALGSHEKIAPYKVPIRRHIHPAAFSRHGLQDRNVVDLSAEIEALANSNKGIPGVTLGVTNRSIYSIPVTIGGQEVRLILDTGSSDTWVVLKNFTCYEHPSYWREQLVDPVNCAFGGYFDPERSPTFQTLNSYNESIRVQYADRSMVSGYVGQDIVEVADIPVNMTIGVISLAKWLGDHKTAGIIGLGYPGTIPSTPGHSPYDWAQNFEDPDDDLAFDCHDAYPSFIQSLASQGNSPVFAVTMTNIDIEEGRDSTSEELHDAGILAFGGIPNIPRLGLPLASAKMNPWYNENSTCPSDFRQIGYGFEIQGITDGDEIIVPGKLPVKLDTGTTINIIPYSLAPVLAARMGPLVDTSMAPWVIDCNATVPELGFIVDKVVIQMDRNQIIRELLLPKQKFKGKLLCYTSFMTNYWNNDFILGVPFLQGSLAVFDFENKEIRLGKRFSDNPTFIPGYSNRSSEVPEYSPPNTSTESLTSLESPASTQTLETVVRLTQ